MPLIRRQSRSQPPLRDCVELRVRIAGEDADYKPPLTCNFFAPRVFPVWRRTIGPCIFITRERFEATFPRAFAQVVSSDEPRTTREEPTVKLFPLPLHKSRSQDSPCASDPYSGFGCAASASRKAVALLLSTTAVPVSTNVGMGGAGAVRQSLKSCTAL